MRGEIGEICEILWNYSKCADSQANFVEDFRNFTILRESKDEISREHKTSRGLSKTPNDIYVEATVDEWKR